VVQGAPAGHSRGRGWSDCSGVWEAERVATAMKTEMSSWETCLDFAAAYLAQLGMSALAT